MLLLCALALRHIDNCTDNFDKFSARGELRVGGRSSVFESSIGLWDSKLEFIISLLVHRLPSLLNYPSSVIGMDYLQGSFAARQPVARIEPQIR